MEEVIVTIKKNGAVQIKTEGFAGASCKDATASLEKALGLKTSDVETEEMYANPARTNLKDRA